MKYDSVHGKFLKNITYSDSEIIIDGRKIHVLNQPNLEALSWIDFDIDVLFECTGHFKTNSENRIHLNNGVKKVILCSPPSDLSVPMVVLGVNDSIINKDHRIISNAS